MRKLLLLCILLLAIPIFAQEVTPEVTDAPFPPEGWIEATGDGFSLLGNQGRTLAIHTAMQPIYDLMAANTNSQATIKLLILADGFLPGCVIDGTGTAVVIVETTPEPCSAETVDLRGYEPVSIADAVWVEDALTQALFERFYPSRQFPAWFVSGIVDFYAPTPKPDLFSQTQDIVRANRSLTLDQLEAVLAAPSNARFAATVNSDLIIGRLQSYGMIFYILDRLGVEGLFALAGEAGDFSAAYERRVGEPLTALLSNWQNWSFTRAAELAYGVNPYQSPTTTPTPSITPTSTVAPTLTPTPAPTLIPTVFVTLTPSRAPTRTASWTPSPYPATSTPRPPGSPLMIATETPTPPPPFQLPRLNIVVVLIMLLVILVLVYVVLSYRK